MDQHIEGSQLTCFEASAVNPHVHFLTNGSHQPKYDTDIYFLLVVQYIYLWAVGSGERLSDGWPSVVSVTIPCGGSPSWLAASLIPQAYSWWAMGPPSYILAIISLGTIQPSFGFVKICLTPTVEKLQWLHGMSSLRFLFCLWISFMPQFEALFDNFLPTNVYLRY